MQEELRPESGEVPLVPEERVALVASFDELYLLLDELGGVQGGSRFYTPEKFRQDVEQVRHGHRDINYITNTNKIRSKVEELLVGDSVYAKYVVRNKKGARG